MSSVTLWFQRDHGPDYDNDHDHDHDHDDDDESGRGRSPPTPLLPPPRLRVSALSNGMGGSSTDAHDVEPALARRQQCRHFAVMAVQITIRDVPEAVRDEIAARAARARLSMQEFLRNELERITSRPSVDAWLEQVHERKSIAAARVPRSAILRARDADRR